MQFICKLVTKTTEEEERKKKNKNKWGDHLPWIVSRLSYSFIYDSLHTKIKNNTISETEHSNTKTSAQICTTISTF